jgi:hypothetical protein
MSVLDAFFAGRCAAEFASQITFQGCPHRAIRSGSSFDPKFLKKLNGATAHSAAEHDIGALLFNKFGNLTGLVARIIRILDHFYRFEFSPFNVHKGEKWTTPKVMGYHTF